MWLLPRFGRPSSNLSLPQQPLCAVIGWNPLSLAGLGGALFLAGSLFAVGLQAQPSTANLPSTAESVRVQQISFKGSGEAIEVQIQTSAGIVPESQSIASPDRIIVDFPGALPAADLRSMKLNYGPLKAIRTGIFSANPPITRVVLDLAEPQTYQIVSAGNTVTLKLRLSAGAGQRLGVSGSSAAPAVLVPVSGVPATLPPNPPPPAMTVNFQHGLLRIHAKGATLAEVLFEVQKQTGAEIPIPAGAEEEMVAADLGPAPPKDVLASLLNGSRYNFIFIDSDQDHTLQKAILSVR